MVGQNQARTAAGRDFVIKCGGSTLAALPDLFFEDLRRLAADGWNPVIVHGGGPAISEMLTKLGIETEFVGGLRKTTEEVLDVVEMVLAGQINKQIVRRLGLNRAKAIGLSGVDGNLLLAEPVANSADVGFVGDVVQVNTVLIRGVSALGCIPVIAPIGIDQAGRRYNINADTAAGAVASFLGARQLIVVTDVPGILRSTKAPEAISDGAADAARTNAAGAVNAGNGAFNGKTALPQVTIAEIEQMIDDGEIYGGMIPKVRAAVQCIQGDVREVVIVSGAEPDVLSKVLHGASIGTRIVKQ